jgi:hypothetical protein
MTQQTINVGAAPNDGSGDSARAAAIKSNSNFDELYSRPSGVKNLTDVWNNVATVFTAFKLAITNTASAAGSKVLDFQVGGQSVVEHTLAQNGTFTVRAQPPHGQAFSVTPRNDTNGACCIVSNGFNIDNTISIGAGSPTANLVALSSVASGTTRALKVTPGVINLPPIAAPSAPQNGDMWMQSDGLYVRVNGATLKVAAA